MIDAKALRGALALAVSLLALVPAAALGAESEPAWNAGSLPTPTQFLAGATTGEYFYDVRAGNIGAKATDGSDVTITDTLPQGLVAEDVHMKLRSFRGGLFDYGPEACNTTTAGETQTVTCTVSDSLPEVREQPAKVFPGEEIRIEIEILAPASLGEGVTLTNHVEIEGGGAPAASITTENETATLDGEGNPEPAPTGIAYLHNPLTGPDGQPVGGAGSHPFQMTTSFAVNTDPPPPGSSAHFVPAGGDIKNVQLALPPGLIGNPNAVARCTSVQFDTLHSANRLIPGGDGTGIYVATACPDNSAVGMVMVQQIEGVGGAAPLPLYNLTPPPGLAAQFGFEFNSIPFFINITVRNGSDYGINATLHNLTQAKRLTASTVTIWGNPADPRHDAIRGSCIDGIGPAMPISAGSCPAVGIGNRPSLRLPTSCAEPLDLQLNVDNWTTPGVFSSKVDSFPNPAGCNQLEFEPKLEARPTTDVADSPSGLSADLHLPQNEDPEGLSTADLRGATVTLPKGLAINPSSANGLDACTPAQIGLTSSVGQLPVQFTPDPSNCPPGARIGAAEVNTPLVDHPLKGGVYVASPHDNPFNSLLALYIAINDPQTGVNLKLAGEVHADPQTGQLTTSFAENPQQPFEDFKLNFFGGAGAALRTPGACGTYSTTSVLTPWSAPESGSPATPSDTYSIAKEPGGGACPSSAAAEPNSPSFDLGTEAPIAKAYSPLLLHLRREDGSQEITQLSATLPKGLIGRLAGIAYCPDSALASAEAKSGAQEKASPSCPASSRVGTVTVGAGAGPAPYYTQGTAYLTGPYKGAPLGMAIITPATAGPYDLGTVVVRTALRIDPESAQITAVSDPIPHILQGVPLDLRTIALRVDRPDFTLNPTSCNPLAATGVATSLFGQGAALSAPFQVGECGGLAFKPKLSLKLKGKTNRGAHPALTAILTMPEGANIAHAAVTLPHSEFIDQGHFQTICTRVQYAEGATPGEKCPPGSIYGHVTATSPLLDAPLQGPAYLRSSSHELPDLVLSLNGQIHIDAVGRVDSYKGGLRTRFETVPDAPVSKLVLQMEGGKKGLFINSTDICKGTHLASAEFDAQNGKTGDSSPPLKAQCKGKQGRKGKHHRAKSRAAR